MTEETIEIKSGSSNGRIAPKTVSSIYEYYLNGELKEAVHLHIGGCGNESIAHGSRGGGGGRL